MRWGNEVNVMTAQLILEVYHVRSELFDADFFIFLIARILAYLIVLTVEAAHVAVTEEDCTGTSGARNWRLFTVMLADRKYHWQVARAAESLLII